MSKSTAKLWVREEMFTFGIFPTSPSQGIEYAHLRKLSAYVKERNHCPLLCLRSWLRICQYKLSVDRLKALTYFRLFQLLQQRSQFHTEQLKADDIAFQQMFAWNSKDDENRFQVNTYEFLIYLYIQNCLRSFLKSSGKGVECPANRGSLEVSREDTQANKIVKEKLYYGFMYERVGDLLSYLQEGCMDSREIELDIIASLDIIFCCMANPARSDRILGLRSIILHYPDLQAKLDFHALRQTVSKDKFLKWIRETLCYNPWGLSRSIQRCTKLFPPTGITVSDSEHLASENRIVCNGRSSEWAWFAVSNVKNQVYLTGKLLDFVNLFVHRITSSHVYAPGVFTSIIVEKCFSSNINLGAAVKFLHMKDCSNITINGAARIVTIVNCANCRFNLMTPSAPILSSSKSTGLQFGAMTQRYGSLEVHLAQAGIVPELTTHVHPFCISTNPKEVFVTEATQGEGEYPFVFTGAVSPWTPPTSKCKAPLEMTKKLMSLIQDIHVKLLPEANTYEITELILRAFKESLPSSDQWEELRGLVNLEGKWNLCDRHAKSHYFVQDLENMGTETLQEYIGIKLGV